MRFLEHYWWALVLMFVAMVATWNRTHRGPPLDARLTREFYSLPA
jgi:hypothetical protein